MVKICAMRVLLWDLAAAFRKISLASHIPTFFRAIQPLAKPNLKKFLTLYVPFGVACMLQENVRPPTIDGSDHYLSLTKHVGFRTPWRIPCTTMENTAPFGYQRWKPWFTARGARAGDIFLAANTVLMHFFDVAAFLIDGFAFASEALVGQAVGARNRQRFRDAVRLTSIWAGVIGAAASLVIWIGGP